MVGSFDENGMGWGDQKVVLWWTMLGDFMFCLLIPLFF